jgi:hypothetical protein
VQWTKFFWLIVGISIWLWTLFPRGCLTVALDDGCYGMAVVMGWSILSPSLMNTNNYSFLLGVKLTIMYALLYFSFRYLSHDPLTSSFMYDWGYSL